MRIELIEKWGDYSPGTILEPHPHIVKTLIAAGIARRVEDKPADKPIAEAVTVGETAEALPDGEQAVTPPPRRRRTRKGKAAKAKEQ